MKARSLISIAVAAATLAVSTATLAHDDRRGPSRHDGPRAERHMDRHGDQRFLPRSQRHPQFYGPGHVQREVIIVNRHQPAYRHGGPRWHRGQYLPREYRGGRYVVHQYGPRMYAPPRGHHWVNVNGEFLLIAAATGLIAHAILNN